MRGVTQIAPFSAGPMHQLVQVGAAIRHAPQPLRVFMLVGDAQEGINAVHIDPEYISVKLPVVAFWTDDATNAEWLLNEFEAEWMQSIDGAERIRELSKR